jgi:hypothetical protein
MTFPEGLSTTLVTYQAANPAGGGSAQGTVTFELTVDAIALADQGLVFTGGGTYAFNGSGQLVDDAGNVGVRLLPNDLPSANPQGSRWLVTDRIAGAPVRSYYVSLSIDQPEADLATIQQMDAGQAEYTAVIGPPGPEGPAGQDGAPGPQGAQGPTGSTGPTGATGPQGTKGDTGAAGPQGPAGATGATGPKGDPGIQGPAGTVGATGPQGATGAQGPKGDTGATGPQGPAGTPPTGDQAGVARTAYKPADEGVTASTVLQGDDHLTLTVTAGGAYSIDGCLIATGDPAGDLALTITAPAGTVGGWTPTATTLGTTDGTGSVRLTRFDFGATSSMGVTAAGVMVVPTGGLIAGADGTITLQWAQAVSSATATVLRAGSWIRLRRMG